MKTIQLDELVREGYQKDTVSLRRFERGYAPVTIPGVAGFVLGFYWLLGLGWKTEDLTLILVCLAIVGGSCVHAYQATPKSVKTGQAMEKYRRLDGKANEVEFIYVDKISRTYCRRVAMIHGD